MLETPSQIDQFLVLQKKTDEELRALCEAVSLSLEGKRDELVKRLVGVVTDPQNDPFAPQLLALRIMIDQKEIPGAIELLQKCRASIWKHKQWKVFTILNNSGGFYQSRMPTIRCSASTFQKLESMDCLWPGTSQKKLLENLRCSLSNYLIHFVARKGKGNKGFLMLHCQVKNNALQKT